MDYKETNTLLDYYINFIPKNYLKEKKRFFKHWEKRIPYNPKFTYRNISAAKYQKYINKMNSIKSDDVIVNAFINIYKQIAEIHLAWINENYHTLTNMSKKLFGSSDKISLEESIKTYKSLCAKKKVNQLELVSSEEMANLLLAELERQDLTHWKVIFNDAEGTEASIYSAKKTIILKPNHQYSTVDVKRIIFHEIKGHGYQSFNAKNNDKYSELFSSYIGTEIQYEGFAIFTEIQHLSKSEINELICRYVLFMIAVKVAEKSDFWNTYMTINDLCDDTEFSFMAAYRAKFGFKDTSKEGCFQTDNSYLLGAYQTIIEVEKDPKNILKLSAGKFPFEILKYIDLTQNSWTPIEKVNKTNINYFKKTVKEILINASI